MCATPNCIEPRNIQFHHPLTPRGRIREVNPVTEFGLLVEVYRRYREDRTARVHRGRAMWEAGALHEPHDGSRRIVLAYEEDGEPLGYVVYLHGGRVGPGPKLLRVRDFFALASTAYQALWQVLAAYDNVDEIVWDNAPPDDPLPLMLVEPRLLNQSLRDGIMARLVTVEDALAQRPYAAVLELRFELIDAFCPWNGERWRVLTSPEGGQVTRIDGQDVDLALTADTLASLVFGRYTASEAYRAGLLDGIRGREACRRWDAGLRLARPPYEAEHIW